MGVTRALLGAGPSLESAVLFDVAVLAASGAFTGVPDSFREREFAAVSTSVASSASSSETLMPTAPEAAAVGFLATTFDPAFVPTVNSQQSPRLQIFSGSATLDTIVRSPASRLGAYLNANPKAIATLLAHPPTASRVAALWASLTPSHQNSLAVTASGLIGNLEGVPFAVRDAANRRYLNSTVAALTKKISVGIGRASILADRHHLTVLKQVQRTLTKASDARERQLLTFDPAGEVRAAIVVGDLARADYVSYLVPGMFFTVQGQMYDWTVIAADMQKEQARWIARLGVTDTSMRHKTAATVSWIGYSTPGILDVASLAKARTGADLLGASIAGLKATRAGSEPFVSLITHSYGSTAAMIELAKGRVTVDALAMVGSPGGATQKASELDVTNDNVFVGEAKLDPVADTAFYGSDPGSDSFGARRMNVAGGIDVITHKTLGAAVGHLGYFDSGSESMRNFALISLNEGGLVTDGTVTDALRTPGTRAY